MSRKMIATGDMPHGRLFLRTGDTFDASDIDRDYYLERGLARDEDDDGSIASRNRMMGDTEQMEVTTPERPRRGRPPKVRPEAEPANEPAAPAPVAEPPAAPAPAPAAAAAEGERPAEEGYKPADRSFIMSSENFRREAPDA